MWPMSIPFCAYQPSSWRKSFCGSMTRTAVLPGTRLHLAAAKGSVWPGGGAAGGRGPPWAGRQAARGPAVGGGVGGGHARAPEPVALLEPQRLERAVAEVDEPERLGRLDDEVVEGPLVLERMVELE